MYDDLAMSVVAAHGRLARSARLCGISAAVVLSLAGSALAQRDPPPGDDDGPGAPPPLFNLPYESPGNDHRAFLDLYRPHPSVPFRSPTFIIVHGGSYCCGDKWDMREMADELADAGYPAVSMNYTLGSLDSPSYPQPIRDVKAVVRWVRTVGATTYNLPGEIVIVGASAGSTIASTAATSYDNPQFEVLPPPPGGYRLSGMILLWGRYDLVWNGFVGVPDSVRYWYLGTSIYQPGGLARYSEASAITYVNNCSPPAMLLAAADDSLVQPENTVRLNNALTNAGVWTTMTIAPFGGHGGGFGGNRQIARTIMNFGLPGIQAYTFPPICPRFPPPPPPPPPPSPEFKDTADTGHLDVDTTDLMPPPMHVDLPTFLRSFTNGDPKADLDGSGGVTSTDLFIAVTAVLTDPPIRRR